MNMQEPEIRQKIQTPFPGMFDLHNRQYERGNEMAVVKVIEILAESTQSWEAAAQDAVNEVAKTIDNIQSIYVEGFQGIVEGTKIVKYRVNTKISFIVKNKQ